MPETRTKRAGPRKQTPAKVKAAQREAMVEGRRQAQAVRSYLEALKASNAPKRKGRKRTPDSIRKRLEAITIELASADLDPLRELRLIQEQSDLTGEMQALEAKTLDPADFETGFIDVAKAYGARQGISMQTWRQLGVPRKVLERAGIV